MLFHSPFLNNPLSSSTTTPLQTALIILNRPLPPLSPIHPTSSQSGTTTTSSPTIFSKLWDTSHIRICADGGANRLYDAITASQSSSSQQHFSSSADDLIPDAIVGDLDSLRDDVRCYYQDFEKCRIVREEDQDRNDLDKALSYFVEWCIETQKRSEQEKRGNWRVCVYGAFGGRFDQDAASLQALFKWRNGRGSLPSAPFMVGGLYLYTEETSAVLLEPNVTNEIKVCKDVEGPSCGLIPIGGRCDVVRTTGLKWNLDGSIPLEFGGLVSTSNCILEDVVTVDCSMPLVWSVEIRREGN